MNTRKEIIVDNLITYVCKDRTELGKKASEDVISYMEDLLKKREFIRIVFAAAPSQNEFLKEMVNSSIDWSRVDAFHMDEYIGLKKDAPQTFGNYLKDNIFDLVKFRSVNFIDPNNEVPEEECKRYADLLTEEKIDIVFMGIGENGHIAFNDPPVADFFDEELVKVVELEEACRLQQVNDGCFNKLPDVPTTAYTLTIPALLSADYLSVCVPGSSKADAIYKTLKNEISTDCPSTILRKHKNVKLYIDDDSASLLR